MNDRFLSHPTFRHPLALVTAKRVRRERWFASLNESNHPIYKRLALALILIEIRVVHEAGFVAWLHGNDKLAHRLRGEARRAKEKRESKTSFRSADKKPKREGKQHGESGTDSGSDARSTVQVDVYRSSPRWDGKGHAGAAHPDGSG